MCRKRLKDRTPGTAPNGSEGKDDISRLALSTVARPLHRPPMQ